MMLAMMAFMVVKVGNTYYISHIKNERDKSTSPVIYVIHVCLCVCERIGSSARKVQYIPRWVCTVSVPVQCALFARHISICMLARTRSFQYRIFGGRRNTMCVCAFFTSFLFWSLLLSRLSLLLFGAAQVCVCLCVCGRSLLQHVIQQQQQKQQQRARFIHFDRCRNWYAHTRIHAEWNCFLLNCYHL